MPDHSGEQMRPPTAFGQRKSPAGDRRGTVSRISTTGREPWAASLVSGCPHPERQGGLLPLGEASQCCLVIARVELDPDCTPIEF